MEVMSLGLLLGYPMVDIKVSLLDGKTHPVDSADSDFKEAAFLACRENKDKLGLTLLEPIMHLEVTSPKDYVGDVLADLSSRRMLIENTEEEENLVTITGKIALREILSYSTTLSRVTKGRGRYSTILFNYQEVSNEKLQEILNKEKLSR